LVIIKPVERIGEERILSVAKFIDLILSGLPGYVTVEEAGKNEERRMISIFERI
jgi:hypothetical protein